MLCTRMQLTERRYRIKSSLTYQNIDGDESNSATISTESRAPFVRPCAIIKMFNSDNGDSKESDNSGRTASAKSNEHRKDDESDGVSKTDVHGSQTNLDKYTIIHFYYTKYIKQTKKNYYKSIYSTQFT